MKSDRATDPAVKRPARSFVVTTPTADKVSGNTSSAQDRRYKSTPSITPGHDDVLAAAVSLYADELKPFGRILRKRIAEQAAARTNSSPADSLPDVDMKHLIKVCASSPQLRIMNEEGGDWSAVIVGRAQQFVNVYSPTDFYPPELWEQADAYFRSLSPEEMKMPGGRYACAQVLVARNLPFLANRSLGQVCHMVQLAISQKRILGYHSGSTVPYSRSQSMMKEWCAYKGAHCTSQGTNAANANPMPLANWDEARIYLRLILQNAATPKGPGMIPLSNVKRLFRSQFHVELSETVLGYSKLSELLQDNRFKDICTIQLQGRGYVVMENPQSPNTMNVALSWVEALPSNGMDDSAHASKEPARVQLDSDSPFCRNRERVGSDTSTAEAIEPYFSPSPPPPGTMWPPTPDVSPGRNPYRSPTRSSVSTRQCISALFDARHHEGAAAAVEKKDRAHGGLDGRLGFEVGRPFSSSPRKGTSIRTDDVLPRSPSPRSISSKLSKHDSISHWPPLGGTDALFDPQDKMKDSACAGRDHRLDYHNSMERSPSISTCYPTPCARMGYSPGRSSRHSNGGVTSPSLHDEPMKVSLGREVDDAAKEAQELSVDHERTMSPRVRPRLKFMLDEPRPGHVVPTPLRNAHQQQESRPRIETWADPQSNASRWSTLSLSMPRKEPSDFPDFESVGRSHSVPRKFGSKKDALDSFANARHTPGNRPYLVDFSGSPTPAVAGAQAGMGPLLEFMQTQDPIQAPTSTCLLGGSNWCGATSLSPSPTALAMQQVLHLSELL